ncbi:MAG: RHS repeat-associated core domain-containing protein, partial [Planctomycetota bacterium]
TITDALGTVRSSSMDNNRYTYTGREWDATLGLYHFRARMYDPSAGRFLGRDPVRYVDGVNTYVLRIAVSKLDAFGFVALDWDPVAECQKIRDKKKKFKPEEMPKIPPKASKKCSDDIDVQLLFTENERLAEYMRKFGDGCPMPSISCKCCPSGYGGFYSGGGKGKPGTLTICTNKDGDLPDVDALEEILVHELTHALQTCHRRGKKDKCANSLTREMEAYVCSGTCTDFASCFKNAIVSSCWNSCTNPDWFTPTRIQQAEEWFESHKSDFCKFPNPVSSE